MSEFASAAMVRLLRRGMVDLGLDPDAALPGPASERSGDRARIDLDDKRRLVAAALAQGGWSCLPLLGRGMHHFAEEATYRALASARDAADLLARWQRLERYIHSVHRVRVLQMGEGTATLRHVALGAGAAPLPAEDLVVLGVLAALLEALGAEDVRVDIGGTAAYPRGDRLGLEGRAHRGATATWRFRWRGQPGSAIPPARGEGAPDRREEAAMPPRRWMTSDPVHALVQAARERLAQDLMRPPGVTGLAVALGVPARTLQRQLGRVGLTYSHLVAETRCRASAWRLIETRASLAEVGFLCGYADQPHFTRSFRERVGLTPARYRAEFAAMR